MKLRRTGRPMVGIGVQATSTAGAIHTVRTAADGTYEFPALPAGQYDFRVQVSGFRTNQGVIVLDGRTRVRRDLVLAIGSISQEITVTGRHPSKPATTRALLTRHGPARQVRRAATSGNRGK